MADKKKGLALAIIAGSKPPKESPAQDPMQEESSPKRMAAEEVMQAFESKDAAALEESLQSFIELCQSEPYSEDEEMKEE